MMRIFESKSTGVMDPDEMNLSLNGCGYLGIYHVGVCSCIKKYYPRVLKGKISGGSVGALVACAFMCDVPLDVCAKYVFDVSMKVRNGILGPMSPDLNIMKVLHDSMDAMLPGDAHLHCDGRLHVSVTRFDNGKNVLLSRFKSREELLQALMCSCFIPVYCGYEPPEFYGVAYVDAALSNNSPWLNKYTVIVAPFSGNSDICPENDGLFLKSLTLSNTSIGLTAKNMYMLFRVLFPASPDIQKDICQQGYNDALRFLRNNDLISCMICVNKEKRASHLNCEAPEDRMPVEISNEIEQAIRVFRKDLGYRLFQYRSMKFLYYLNIPSIVTAKVSYLLISAILQKVQNKAGSCVDDIWGHFLQILKEGLYRPNSRPSLQNDNSEISQLDADVKNCYRSEADSNGVASSDDQGYEFGLVSDETPSETENSDALNDDTNIVVPEIPASRYSSKVFSIPMSAAGQSCQPLAEGKIDIQVNDQLEAY